MMLNIRIIEIKTSDNAIRKLLQINIWEVFNFSMHSQNLCVKFELSIPRFPKGSKKKLKSSKNMNSFLKSY